MMDVRKDFPFLERHINGRPIVYFDNAATVQKPRQVIQRVYDVYANGISNVHRAVNFLADEVTTAFEESRQQVAQFLGAEAREIIFVSNATHAINLVWRALSRKKSMRVVTTTLEHHSNFLPWTTEGTVDFVPWSDDGSIDTKALATLLSKKPDLMTFAAASNFLGTIQPVKEIVNACRSADVPVLIDASQSIRHERLNVRELSCDFLVFSGHKIYGPSGVGVLYIKREILDAMDPVFLGGSMVKEVHARNYVPNDIPYRFEAGTPNIEGVIGLSAALEYVLQVGFDAIHAHETELVTYAKRQLAELPGVKLFGPPAGVPSAPLVTFQAKSLEPTGVTKVLANRANVVVRSGFHCAQPAHDQLGLNPTVRASFAMYNTKEEIDSMVHILRSIRGSLE